MAKHEVRNDDGSLLATIDDHANVVTVYWPDEGQEVPLDFEQFDQIAAKLDEVAPQDDDEDEE